MAGDKGRFAFWMAEVKMGSRIRAFKVALCATALIARAGASPAPPAEQQDQRRDHREGNHACMQLEPAARLVDPTDQGQGGDSPGRESANATRMSFAGLPVSPWPPAAITTYCLPFHS